MNIENIAGIVFWLIVAGVLVCLLVSRRREKAIVDNDASTGFVSEKHPEFTRTFLGISVGSSPNCEIASCPSDLLDACTGFPDEGPFDAKMLFFISKIWPLVKKKADELVSAKFIYKCTSTDLRGLDFAIQGSRYIYDCTSTDLYWLDFAIPESRHRPYLRIPNKFRPAESIIDALCNSECIFAAQCNEFGIPDSFGKQGIGGMAKLFVINGQLHLVGKSYVFKVVDSSNIQKVAPIPAAYVDHLDSANSVLMEALNAHGVVFVTSTQKFYQYAKDKCHLAEWQHHEDGGYGWVTTNIMPAFGWDPEKYPFGRLSLKAYRSVGVFIEGWTTGPEKCSIYRDGDAVGTIVVPDCLHRWALRYDGGGVYSLRAPHTDAGGNNTDFVLSCRFRIDGNKVIIVK